MLNRDMPSQVMIKLNLQSLNGKSTLRGHF